MDNEYQCANKQCRKIVKSNLIIRRIRCPYCNSKVLEKHISKGQSIRIDAI